MEETVSKKASNDSVVKINQTLEEVQTSIENINTNISTNYVTHESADEKYATIE
jgi:uncharacterized protein YukE